MMYADKNKQLVQKNSSLILEMREKQERLQKMEIENKSFKNLVVIKTAENEVKFHCIEVKSLSFIFAVE